MLVNCVAYQEGRKLGDLLPAEIGSHVSRPECFVWVALKDATPEELVAMQRQFNLHELAVEDARHGHQRPKIEEYGDSLFVVLHTVERVEGEIRSGEVDVFVGPNYVLSVRSRSEQGFASVRARCEREPELLRQGSGFVLYALMDAVVDRYFPVVELLEQSLDEIEARIFQGAPARSTVEALHQLKQKVTILQHAARPLLEATGKLYGGRVPPVCLRTQDYYRDVYDHLLRINQSIEALRDSSVTAMSVNLSLITLQENETTKRLAAYAALVAVPTMIAGFYGMNFVHMPGLHSPWGAPATLILAGLLDLLLYKRLRSAGWL